MPILQEPDHAHPASLVGSVIARTFQLTSLLEIRDEGALYRAHHVVRPEPFQLILCWASDPEALAAAYRLGEDVLRSPGRRSLPPGGPRTDFLQQGKDARLQRTFVAWPIPLDIPEPVAFRDRQEVERRLTGQVARAQTQQLARWAGS